MSPTEDPGPVRQRRRGAELEAALLTAAWQELLDTGYDALTIEGVAERAATSRAVVYRRWPTKPALVHAAVVRAMSQERADTPDTGALRSDVIALLRQLNSDRLRLGIVLLTRLGEFFNDAGVSLADLRDEWTAGAGSRMTTILERAQRRGEFGADALTPRIARLPMDLFRHEVMITLAAVPHHVIDEIVDEIFLPLLATRSG